METPTSTEPKFNSPQYTAALSVIIAECRRVGDAVYHLAQRIADLSELLVRLMDYTEFKVGVTVWSLESDEEQACDELRAICRLLKVDEIAMSPAEMYPRETPLVRRSTSDPGMFLAIDMSHDPTDQMDGVGLMVRCASDVADAIHEALKAIRDRSEVKSALLRGNLGLTPP